MRKTLFVILCCMMLSAAPIDDPIKLTAKDILSSVQKERRFVNSQKSIEFLNSLNFRTPYLREMRFRYGADDITNSKQQYALGFGFSAWGIAKRQQAFKTAQINTYQAKKEILAAEIIKERYDDIADIYFSQKLLQKQQSLDSLLQQRQAAFKTSLQRGLPVRIKDLVETEEDLRQLKQEMNESQALYVKTYNQIRNYLDLSNDFIFRFDNIISVNQMSKIIFQINANKVIQTPEIKLLQDNIGLAQAELSLEEAAFKKIFDDIQVIYEKAPKNDFTIKDFAFRVGVNIPIKGNFRTKQNDILMEIKDAENDYNFTYFETDRNVKMQIMKLDNKVKQYQQNLEQLHNSLAQTILNATNNKNNKESTVALAAALTPMDIIDLKIIQQKKEVDLIVSQYELVREFVLLLNLTGELSKTPYRNYLSANLENW